MGATEPTRMQQKNWPGAVEILPVELASVKTAGMAKPGTIVLANLGSIPYQLCVRSHVRSFNSLQ